MYDINNTHDIITPALVVFRELVQKNLREMVRIAGSPERLRPHCKTHKMTQVVQMGLGAGITRHKCATLAEAEALARAGVRDILWAYAPVGPNVQRVVSFCQTFPQVALSVTFDHERPLRELNAAATQAAIQVEVLLDLDTGMRRTGIAPGAAARDLYRTAAGLPGIKAGGFHLYDGQNNQTDLEQRRQAVLAGWQAAQQLRKSLVADGLQVNRIVAGGTGSFPLYAEMDDPALEASPGTCIFHDAGYAAKYPDLSFTPAAALLTRVVSRPAEGRITFDLGYKACASDPPLERRVRFPRIPDARIVLQNEEHLAVETDQAQHFTPGDTCLAIPWHICPTCALHKEACIIEGGELVDRWAVAARDRQLTI